MMHLFQTSYEKPGWRDVAIVLFLASIAAAMWSGFLGAMYWIAPLINS